MLAQTRDAAQAERQGVFHCSMCGECCTSVTVPIEREKAVALAEKPWVRERLAETGLAFEPLDRDHLRVPLTRANTCVFLAEDNRCLIEAHEGKALKPRECLRFPFAAVKTPGGIGYDVSASCKTVAEDLLIGLASIIPAPGQEPEPADDRLPRKIPVGLFRRIDHQVYRAYREAVARIFREEALSPELALKRVFQVVRALPSQPRTLARTFRFKSFWAPWIRFAFLRHPYGMLNRWAVLVEGTYADPKIFGPEPVVLKGHRRIPLDPALDPLLKGYLHNLLQRQVLLAHGHSLEGLLAIATHACFIVRWYARTLALIAGNPRVEATDLALAIRLTERYYTGHQPVFLEFFRVSALVGPYLASLFRG